MIEKLYKIKGSENISSDPLIPLIPLMSLIPLISISHFLDFSISILPWAAS